MLLLMFFMSLPAHAASLTYSCTSYSGEYDMKVELRSDGATIDVTRSSKSGPLALPLGKIKLEPRQEETSSWFGYEGYSSRNNHVTFRMQYADLQERGEVEPNLNVSPDWTDTYDVQHGLRCQRQ